MSFGGRLSGLPLSRIDSPCEPAVFCAAAKTGRSGSMTRGTPRRFGAFGSRTGTAARGAAIFSAGSSTGALSTAGSETLSGAVGAGFSTAGTVGAGFAFAGGSAGTSGTGFSSTGCTAGAAGAGFSSAANTAGAAGTVFSSTGCTAGATDAGFSSAGEAFSPTVWNTGAALPKASLPASSRPARCGAGPPDPLGRTVA